MTHVVVEGGLDGLNDGLNRGGEAAIGVLLGEGRDRGEASWLWDGAHGLDEGVGGSPLRRSDGVHLLINTAVAAVGSPLGDERECTHGLSNVFWDGSHPHGRRHDLLSDEATERLLTPTLVDGAEGLRDNLLGKPKWLRNAIAIGRDLFNHGLHAPAIAVAAEDDILLDLAAVGCVRASLRLSLLLRLLVLALMLRGGGRVLVLVLVRMGLLVAALVLLLLLMLVMMLRGGSSGSLVVLLLMLMLLLLLMLRLSLSMTTVLMVALVLRGSGGSVMAALMVLLVLVLRLRLRLGMTAMLLLVGMVVLMLGRRLLSMVVPMMPVLWAGMRARVVAFAAVAALTAGFVVRAVMSSLLAAVTEGLRRDGAINAISR